MTAGTGVERERGIFAAVACCATATGQQTNGADALWVEKARGSFIALDGPSTRSRTGVTMEEYFDAMRSIETVRI